MIANYYTKRNAGIREPEMRLPTCAIAAVLTLVGALIYSLCLHFQTHWIGCMFGIGILSTGGQMGATLAMTYALDCHKEVSFCVIKPRVSKTDRLSFSIPFCIC